MSYPPPRKRDIQIRKGKKNYLVKTRNGPEQCRDLALALMVWHVGRPR